MYDTTARLLSVGRFSVIFEAERLTLTPVGGCDGQGTARTESARDRDIPIERATPLSVSTPTKPRKNGPARNNNYVPADP
jgi:hypothetical protein